MDSGVPAAARPAASIDEVVARMRSIDAALPAHDGVASFNRMYLDVTVAVSQRVAQGGFGDPAFVAHLDVVFANLYFRAIDAMSGPRSAVPVAWRPLLSARKNPGIEPIQFALAGMNAHINHDLPLAVVRTCRELRTTPDDGHHHEDYERINVLLDAADDAIRRSFEPKDLVAVDRHLSAVANVISNWSISTAREVAWQTAQALWDVRGFAPASDLLTDALARTVAMASRGLLVVV